MRAMILRTVFLLLGVALCAPMLAQTGSDPDVRETDAAGKATIKGPTSASYGGYFRAWYVSGGANVKWSISPQPAGLFFHEFPGAHSVAVGGPAGTYELTATATTATGHFVLDKAASEYKKGDKVAVVVEQATVTTLRHTFTLTGAPGPPIDPVDPPAPLSPLAKEIKAAADVDGVGKEQLRGLAAVFRATGDATVAGKTAAQGEQARARVLKERLAGGLPGNLHAVFVGRMRKVNDILPTSDPNHSVTVAEVERVKAIYQSLAAAIEEAAK